MSNFARLLSGSKSSRTVAWSAPLRAFVLDGDDVLAVLLFGLELTPDGAQFFGVFPRSTLQVHRWPAADVALTDGALLAERLRRRRAA